MELRSYTLEELASQVVPDFKGHEGIVPLSPPRLASYLENPRAERSDRVLFVIRHEGRLVAYRTLLPDCFYDGAGQPRRFAWLSGNYVIPDFRRQGLSTRLLQLAVEQWGGKLMYTNYAPDSKAVYDQTGAFPLLVRRNGKRFHLRSASGELLGSRLGGKGLMQAGDRLLNHIREGKLRKFDPVDPSRCRMERITSFDPEVSHLIAHSLENSLFRRDAGIFSWILDHPWVTGPGAEPLNYHFSYRARKFENILWKCSLPGERGLGLLWLVVHDRKLSAPYLFSSGPELYPMLARQLIHTMITTGCAYATIRHTELLPRLMEHKAWFLAIRPMPQLLFSHQELAGLVPAGRGIQDGDGDVVFTG